ncbi:hypothetical protein ABH926_007262 [Catenulispora sp. GP43]|uniref:hypothetical protein n=1 Tax=Catenulispora sp. GP43 TaxID=3156263 RepID=UPI003513FDBB
MSAHRSPQLRRRSVTRAARLSAGLAVFSALASAAGCASDPKVPQVAFPSVSAPSVRSVQVPPVATYSGYAPPLNAVQAQISGVGSSVPMAFRMAPVEIDVTVTNSSNYSFQNLEPLVVLGQCTCDAANGGTAPQGFLDIWDDTVRAWRSSGYSAMQADQTFKFSRQSDAISLGRKASVTLRYRVYLGKTAKETGLVRGTGAFDFYLLQLPNHTRIKVGTGPDAFVPLTYDVG